MWETRGGGGGQLGAGRRIILWEKWETNITFPSCSSLCSSPSSRLPLCASLRHSPVPRAAWAPGYAPLPMDTVCLPPVRGKEKVGGGGGGRGPLAGLGQPLPRGSVLAPSSPRFGMGGGWTHRGSPGMASRGWAERSNTRPRRAGSSTEGLSEHHRHPGGVGPSEIKETRSPVPGKMKGECGTRERLNRGGAGGNCSGGWCAGFVRLRSGP